jgi:hypothetical protein
MYESFLISDIEIRIHDNLLMWGILYNHKLPKDPEKFGYTIF